MPRVGRLLLVSLSWVAGVAAVAACSSGDPAAPDGPKGLPGDPVAAPSGGSVSGPTFHKDIEPILQDHCQKCHTTGGLAPFQLLTFSDAHKMSPAMVAETAARRMPPWGAQDSAECKPRLPWAHDERLTAVELKTLADWDAAGAPEGDPKAAPPPRAIDTLELKGATDTLLPKTPFSAEPSNT